MIAPRFNSAAADRSAAKATPPAFAPHSDAPFPGNGFRLSGRDGASLSFEAARHAAPQEEVSIAVAAFADGSTGAEASPSPASAPATAAPLSRYSPGDESGAVILSEASSFVLRLIAIHDRATESDVLARLIVAHAKEIGLSPLLGRHFEDSS